MILSTALTLSVGLVTKRMRIEIPPPAHCCVLEQDILSSVLSAQQAFFYPQCLVLSKTFLSSVLSAQQDILSSVLSAQQDILSSVLSAQQYILSSVLSAQQDIFILSA